jgi:hypothetical protein
MLNLALVKRIADARLPEVVVPAGFNQVVYEPRFLLSVDKKNYPARRELKADGKTGFIKSP